MCNHKLPESDTASPHSVNLVVTPQPTQNSRSTHAQLLAVLDLRVLRAFSSIFALAEPGRVDGVGVAADVDATGLSASGGESNTTTRDKGDDARVTDPRTVLRVGVDGSAGVGVVGTVAVAVAAPLVVGVVAAEAAAAAAAAARLTTALMDKAARPRP